MRPISVTIVLASFSVLSLAGCLFAPLPAPPAAYHFAIETQELVPGLGSTYVSGITTQGEWFYDNGLAFGDERFFNVITGIDGRYYSIDGRVPARWSFRTLNGACPGNDVATDVNPGDVKYLICIPPTFHSTPFGYVADSLPDDYWGLPDALEPPSLGTQGTLGPTQTIGPGQALVSQNGQFRLLYQLDGNLVIYRSDWSPIWATYSFGAPGNVSMQGDGNLVVYNPSGVPQWASGTWGNSGAYLALQNDGNLVIYTSGGKPLFWTGTADATPIGPPSPPTSPTSPPPPPLPSPSIAVVTQPTSGASNVSVTQPIQWTAVSGAEAYYLYVGSGVGLNDYLNTGEIQVTSYSAASIPRGRTVFARLWTKVAGVWYYSPDISFSTAADSSATTSVFVYPTSGMTNVNVNQSVTWTTVPNVQAYYLYVGTAVGLNDLVNTGEIQSTSYLAGNLPSNQTVYARISTKVANAWHYTDISFTTGPPAAQFIYPTNGTSTADPNLSIQWSVVSGADAYYLYVGSAVGLKDLVDTGEIQQTSYAGVGLPENQTLYARIWTKVVNQWSFADIAFALSPRSTILVPANGAADANYANPIQWTTVSNAQLYYLYVGTAPGLKDLVDSGEVQSTSFVASTLPANQTVYARVWTKISGTWVYSDSSFAGRARSTFIFPTDGASSVDLTQAVHWTSVPGAQAYSLYIGTAFGLKDLVDTGVTQSTSYAAVNLPTGQTLYARINTEIGGVWYSTDISFSGRTIATFISPQNGSSSVNLSVPITWTSVPGAQAYYLKIGTAVGLSDIVNTGEIQQTSYTATGLPTGQTLYARIWTKLDDHWNDYYNDITFSGYLKASFVAPVNGTTVADLTLPIQWTSIQNAQAYYLTIGTGVGLSDVVNTGEIQQTTYTPSALPVGQMLYARIWTKLNGHWNDYYNDVSFSGYRKAVFMTPAQGATNVDLLQPISWTSVPSAQSYYLYVGTAVGLKDLASSGEIQTTSYSASNLPPNQTLYARIWTKAGGHWYFADRSFAGVRKSTFIAPTGGTNVDLTVPIQWVSVAGAQAYYLYVGTGVGLHDLINSGETQQTTYSGATLPVGQTLYGRINTKINGTWYYQDLTFSGHRNASFIAPTNGSTTFDLSLPIQWTSITGAQAYQLLIGTVIGSSDILDTGAISATTYSASSVPHNQTVNARLMTKVAGIWYPADISFSGIRKAVTTSPANGASISSVQTFQWTTVSGIQAYYLYVGTAIGLHDVVNTGEIQGTSYAAQGLPAGTLYVRIWTKILNTWYYSDSTVTVQ